MSRFLCLTVLALSTALEHPPFYVGQTCSDGSGCPGAEVCCPYYSSAAGAKAKNIDDDQPSKGFLCCNPPADGRSPRSRRQHAELGRMVGEERIEVALRWRRHEIASCCGGGCCDPVETCAADAQGYACCYEQVTFVCEAQLDIGLPSRCCPRPPVCSRVGPSA